MSAGDATTARRKAMAEEHRTCGNCGWLNGRTFECRWEFTTAVPVWVTPGPWIKRMDPGYDASKCQAWKLAEAADVAAQEQRKEDPCKT